VQFHCVHGEVHCPVCDAILTILSEQDARVARVRHDLSGDCSLSNRTYRVDRRNGYGEAMSEA
jgi:uncharacterized Zn finger protein (UPF0148 family)